MKRKMGLFLVALMLLAAITGCSSKTKEADKTSEEELSMGRYVEEDMGLPSGVDPSGFLSIAISPSGEIELYAFSNRGYEKYLYVNKSWNKAEETMQFDGLDFGNLSISDVFYGEDGEQYVLCDTFTEYRNELYRLSGSGKYEKVEVKRFEDSNEEWHNIPYRPQVLKVLENGMIAAVYPWGVIEVYSSDGQSTLWEYNCGKSCLLTAEGNTLYYIDSNDKEILSTNMETKEEGAPRPVEVDVYDSGTLVVKNGSMYIGNTSGISLNKEGSTLWEILIEGSQTSLSMPSQILRKFILGAEDEFYYALSNVDYTEVALKHVYYDETVSSVPPVELSIFSIEDNPTIRQAVSAFQAVHPEIKVTFRVANVGNRVKYTYGIKDPEETITLKDHINALNTELLAGRGADILVLDGIPIDSYIEKGVLEDMGSIFTPMKDEGRLLSNITDPYFTNGKVYAMPIRFKLPIIYGASEAVDASKTIEELAEYARNSGDTPLLTPSNYRALAAWFLVTNYGQIFNQDNEIDEAALKSFLKTIDILAKAINASDDAEMDYMNTGSSTTWGYWVSSNFNVYARKALTNIEEVGGFMEMAIPLKVSKVWSQGGFKVLNNSFKAQGLVGVNSATGQKELAFEFIQLLYSDKIQGQDLQDGFPVNKAALEKMIQEDKTISMGATDGEHDIMADYPTADERNKIYESICTLDKPMVNDLAMMDMILDEAERYLKGDITAEQAAQNAVASINLYLTE